MAYLDPSPKPLTESEVPLGEKDVRGPIPLVALIVLSTKTLSPDGTVASKGLTKPLPRLIKFHRRVLAYGA